MEITLNRMAAHMANGAKTGKYDISDRFELEMYCKDGTTIWVEIIASSIVGEDGQPVGILGVTRDISERYKLETQLQLAQRMEAVGDHAEALDQRADDELRHRDAQVEHQAK